MIKGCYRQLIRFSELSNVLQIWTSLLWHVILVLGTSYISVITQPAPKTWIILMLSGSKIHLVIPSWYTNGGRKIYLVVISMSFIIECNSVFLPGISHDILIKSSRGMYFPA